MSRIVVCMDCPELREGRVLSPACDYALTLNNKFNPEDNDEPMGNLAPQAKTKLCKRCGRELPLVRFGKNASTKDGLQYWCKDCQNLSVTASKAKKRAAEDSFLGKSEPKPEPEPQTEQRRPGEPGGLEPMERPIPGSEFMILPKAEPQPRQDPRLENFESKELANELRARGYMVKASRPIKVIEEL